MTDNVTVAIVTGSCTAVVGIAAIVVNTFWVRYSLEKVGERITELKTDAAQSSAKIERRLELIEADVKEFFKIQGQQDKEIDRLKGKGQ